MAIAGNTINGKKKIRRQRATTLSTAFCQILIRESMA